MAETGCGCKEDFYCPEAEELWAAVGPAYRHSVKVDRERGLSSSYQEYEAAKAAYREHRRQAGV